MPYVKVPCDPECITGNIARDHAPSAIFKIFTAMHGRERYFNWFIVAAFLASAGSPK